MGRKHPLLTITALTIFGYGCGAPEPPEAPLPVNSAINSSDGLPTATEGISLPEGHEKCPHGGTEIIQYKDANNNERWDENEAVLERQYDCFRSPGDGGTTPGGGGNTDGANNGGGDTGGNTGGGGQGPKPNPDGSNQAPVAFALGAAVAAGGSVAINLAAQDADGDVLSNWTITKQPKHGNVSHRDTVATYSPGGSFTGKDSFSYTVSDAKGNVSKEAKVTVIIGGKALLLVNVERNETQDKMAEQFLKDRGFSVQIVNDADAKAEDAKDVDLIAVSDSVSSVQIQAKLKDVKAPMIIWDAVVAGYCDLFNFKIGDGIFKVAGQTQIRSAWPQHPVWSGFNETLNFFQSGSDLFYFEVSPEAEVLGRVVEDLNGNAKPKVVFYRYLAGAKDFKGKPVKGNRVGFPFWKLDTLADDGRKLFGAAIHQALAEP